MNKITGIVGSGMIGRDPKDPTCWSGSGFNLFNALETIGALDQAIGIEVPSYCRYPLMLKNFSLNKKEWIKKFYLDTDYYKHLTKAAKKALYNAGAKKCLQLGAIYDIPSVASEAQCFSYHDGNVVELMQSGYLPEKLIPRAKQAFEWEKKVCSGQEKVFTMSEYLRESFVDKFGISPSKVINIGVGVNFPIPPNNFEKTEDEIHLLFVGIDFERKGGSQLVDAFNKIKDKYDNVTLNIVGPRQLPDKLKGQSLDKIRFWGYLDKNDPSQLAFLKALFFKSNFFVLPSLYEPFGIAVLEAMAYRMPVIASNRWAFPEMVIPRNTGDLVEPGNVDSLSELLDYYISDPNMVSKMGRSARTSIEDNYRWQDVAENMAKQMEL